jgi:hypothetical protein
MPSLFKDRSPPTPRRWEHDWMLLDVSSLPRLHRPRAGGTTTERYARANTLVAFNHGFHRHGVGGERFTENGSM